MEYVVANLLGMLCDGAKSPCAFKVGTGAIEAYHGLVASGGKVLEAQGVVGQDIEETIDNAARVAASMCHRGNPAGYPRREKRRLI
ncbi:hypothetical protein MASR2M79_07170 [Aminivibrio sp.]